MLEAPQVVLTPSSSRSLAHEGKDLLAGAGHGAHRHHQRVDHDVMGRDAEIRGAFDDLLATAKRTSGSSEIPVSSFEIATTARYIS
jgi:hypothetical protein